MSIFEKRMSSFVDRGNKLIAEGKTKEAMKLITQGLQHYSDSPRLDTVFRERCWSSRLCPPTHRR